MKELTKDIYYHYNPDKLEIPRLWHNCENYKDRDLARVEITPIEETEDTITYQCAHCTFEYVLDRHLKLEISKM